jgi:hypothetical protein
MRAVMTAMKVTMDFELVEERTVNLIITECSRFEEEPRKWQEQKVFYMENLI